MKNDVPEKVSPRGYPLGALFLLLTVSGMLAGLVSVAVRSNDRNWQGALVTGVVAMLLGGIIALARTTRLRPAIVVATTGLVVGGLAGSVAVLRTSLMLEAALICISASVLLIVAALIFARRG